MITKSAYDSRKQNRTTPARRCCPQDAKTAAATSRIARRLSPAPVATLSPISSWKAAAREPQDQPYYDAAVGALRADTARHVGSVLDWWSDPVTAPLGTSPDNAPLQPVVWLRGEAGHTAAESSMPSDRCCASYRPVRLRAIVVPAITNDMPMQITARQAHDDRDVAAVIAVLLLLRRACRCGPRRSCCDRGLVAAVAAQPAVIAGTRLGNRFRYSLGRWPRSDDPEPSPPQATMLAAWLGSDAGHSARPPPRQPAAFALPGACVAATGPLLLARTQRCTELALPG